MYINIINQILYIKLLSNKWTLIRDYRGTIWRPYILKDIFYLGNKW